MPNLPFIECAERTEFSDECYGALGRALYVAQQFEAKCRALTTLLDVKIGRATREVGSLDDPEFQDFVNDLWKRKLATNITQLKKYGLPGEISSIFDRARRARNSIAHDITLGIGHKIEKDKGRREILTEIEQCVRDIANADEVIALLIHTVTHEPIPMPGYLEKYEDEVARWVCKNYDDE